MIRLLSNSKTLFFASAVAGGFIAASNVSSAEDAVFWNYYSNSSGSTINMYAERRPEITNNHYAEIGGTNMNDDQRTRWHHLLSGKYAYGQGTKLVRGWDLVEDWDLNWSTPALLANGQSRWAPIDSSGNSQSWTSTRTGNTGPHQNQLFLGNPNMIAAMDDSALFWDSDGTFSRYALGSGSLLADYTWRTLTGGAFDLTELSEELLKGHFIGAEEGLIAFLHGEDVIEFYNLSNGSHERTTDYSVVNIGPLSGEVTLADIIDGNVEGYVYLGIDGLAPGAIIASIPYVAVPEPSTLVLVSLVVCLFPLARRYRRR